MELREGYKQTEVGVIPEDWEISNFGDLVNYTKGYPFKSSEYVDNGVRVIRVSDTTYDSIEDDGAVFVSESSANSYKKWCLRESDLIISTVGSKPPMYDSLVGKVILVPRKHSGSLLNQNAVVIRTKKYSEASQKLLLNHFRTERYIQYIEIIFRGNANQASITLVDLFKYKIPLPPTKTEQTAIANALSDTDAWIQSLTRLITKKHQIKQGAMQTLLNPYENGRLKAGWVVKKLGSIAHVEMGQSPSSQNYNYKGIGLPLVQGNADIKNRKTIIRAYTSEITKKCNFGDIIMSVRAPVGEIAISSFDACIGRGVCAINYLNKYIFHYLISIESGWGKLSKGSTFDSVTSIEVKELDIFLPKGTNEQTRIATILSDMDAEITALETKLAKAQQIKQGMMQNLLTGKIRLV